MSNPDFTPLDRANVRDFSPGLFITAVHRRRGRGTRQKSGFFPRIKNRVCTREKLVWCPPARSARPYIAFLATLPFSRARGFGSIGEIYSARARQYDVAYVGSMFRRHRLRHSLRTASCENANLREDAVHRSNRHNVASSVADTLTSIINAVGIIFSFICRER